MSRPNKALGGVHLFLPILALLLQAVAAEDLPPLQDTLVAAEVAPIDGDHIAEIGSKISQSGEVFPIKLAQPVVLDEIEVLPAGIVGEGQIVHAKKAGMAGSGGELVLAARYLDHDGRRIPLRSFKFIEAGDEILTRGKDNVGIASATNAVIGPLGFLIGGGNTVIAPGTAATAKIRDDEAFDRAGAAPENTEPSQ